MVGYVDIAALSGLLEDVILDQKALARSTGAGAEKGGDDSKEPELLVSLDNAGRGCVIVGCVSAVGRGGRCRQRWVLAASHRHQRQRRDLGTYPRPSRVATASLLWKGVVVTLIIVEGGVVVAAAVVVERGVILLGQLACQGFCHPHNSRSRHSRDIYHFPSFPMVGHSHPSHILLYAFTTDTQSKHP